MQRYSHVCLPSRLGPGRCFEAYDNRLLKAIHWHARGSFAYRRNFIGCQQKPGASKDPAIYVRLPYHPSYASAINRELDALSKNTEFRNMSSMFIDDEAVGVKVAWLALASIIRNF